MNIDCLAKLILACLANFIGHSFELFVKLQWRHETEQSCVENQVKPSLEDKKMWNKAPLCIARAMMSGALNEELLDTT